MAEVKIENNNGEIFRGEYEFIEGGIDKKGKPGFHIDAHSWGFKGENFTFWLEFKDLEEYKEFLKELRQQIPEE